jgi:hypothetical protein
MITRTPYLAQGHPDLLAHQIRSTRPGQAHFANMGPAGVTCGDCIYVGYFRQHRNERGDAVKSIYASRLI